MHTALQILAFCWSSGNAFVFGAGGLRFKSWAGQIGHSVANGSPPRAKSTDRDKLTANKLTSNKLTAKRRFRYSGFVTDFVAVISSQSESLGKMALGIVKIYSGSPFSTNRRCSRSVCSRSVGSQSVCSSQLSWTLTTAATFLRKELCCLGAMTWRWAPPTRYTFQRIIARIMKDLI